MDPRNLPMELPTPPVAPAIGSIVPHPPTFRLSDLASDAFPSLIVVFCDRCGTEHAEDVIVRESDDQPRRFEYLRAHLRLHGWRCDRRADLCPSCSDSTPEG